MAAGAYGRAGGSRYRTRGRSPRARWARRVRGRLRRAARPTLLAIGFVAVILVVLRRAHLL